MLFAALDGCQNPAIKSMGLEVFWIDPLVSPVSFKAKPFPDIVIMHFGVSQLDIAAKILFSFPFPVVQN